MSAYSDLIVADSPVSYWRLNEHTGTTATRLVGASNGTYNNVTLAEPTLVQNDLDAHSVRFNGSSSVITMPGNCGISAVPVSIEFWMKAVAAPIGLFDSAPGQAYVLRNYGTNQFEWWNGDLYGWTPSLNTVYHVVVCYYYTGGYRHIRLYVNGAQHGDQTKTNLSSAAFTSWRFGDINSGSAGRYNGWMQELALYNRLLTLDEVSAHYTLGNAAATMLYRGADLPFGSDPQIGRCYSLPLAPSGAMCEDAHERGVVHSNLVNWSGNRIFSTASMGDPTVVTDWSVASPTGGPILNSGVTADGYLFVTRGNRYVDKIDPNTGAVVLTRDFGAGAMIGERLAAKDVKGVAHLYITSAYNTGSATLRAFSTVDLTDFWTQAWTGCPAGGVYQQYMQVFDTVSGVLIVSTDTSPYYWRCIRDNGATATYLWTSTLATSGQKSCVTNGDEIWGVAAAGGAVQAVTTASGTSAHSATQTNIVAGVAPVLCGRFGFGVLCIGPSAPYKLRKIQLSDGTTPADYPPDFQMPSGTATFPWVDQEGLIYYYDATHLYCLDEWFNLQWTYTHPRTIVTVWEDLERNFYVEDGLEIVCLRNEDRSVLWTIPLLVPAVYAVVPVSDTRIVLYNATHRQGIWIAKHPVAEYVDTFDRDDAASLGADWTDDYFFSDTGAHDFWSIEDDQARITPTGVSTQGGALCLAAPAVRDFDLRMTCTVGVAPTGAQASVGLVYRGIDGRTFMTWIYDAADSGNFKFLWQDNVAAGQTVTTVSANKPTIASGGEIKFRVVVHRQTGYYWMNGQGPYEIGTGFLGEGKFGMFAGRTSGSARVSEFRVTGKSNPPYHQTMHTVSRWSEIAGYEYTGVGALTRQVFRAADGRVMCIWQSMYAANPNARWSNYWAQTTSPGDDVTSWGAATVLNTPGSISTYYGSGCNGWQGDNDNVYALFYCWGSGGIYQNVTFVKFTKVAGGGWTAGSPVTIGSGSVTINAQISICKVPGTGRLWAAIPIWGSAMWMYYSDNEGLNWTSITAPATMLNVSSVPCHLHAWGNNVILVYKPSSPGTTICSKLRDDTQANKNTWGGEVVLYTSQLNTEGYHHGVWLLPSNVDAATFILIIRTSDKILRAKKYLSATGWVSGDTTLAVNQRGANYSRSWWDGTRARAVVHHGAVNAPPIWYDPATNTYEQGGHEAPYYGSSSLAPTGCRYTYSLIKRGYASTGAVGVIVVKQAIDDLYLARPQTMPCEILEGHQFSFVIPVETSEIAAFGVFHDLPLAWDGSTAFGTVSLPFEYLVHPLFSVFHDLPLEILAGKALTVHTVPVESAATLLQGAKTVLAEWLATLHGRTDIPLDAWGIWQALLHRWYVHRKDPGEILHLWQALQKAGIGGIDHSWTVLTEQDQDFPHLWRVIPPELILLHGEDVQLPFGRIEKVG